MNISDWLQSILIILIGAVGTILFKIGVNNSPTVTFSEPLSVLSFVLSPYIIASLSLFLLGRVLLSLPLKTTEVGKYMFIITPLTLVATLALSILIFNEKVNMRETMGILLTIAGVILLGS